MIRYEDLPRSRDLKLPPRGTKPSEAVLQWPDVLHCQHAENSTGEQGYRLCAASILAYVDGYQPTSSYDVTKALRARKLDDTTIWVLLRANDEYGKDVAARFLEKWGI